MTVYQVRNPDYEAYVRGHFRRVAFTTNIGAEIAQVAPGSCTLTLPYRPELGQQHGFFHGGIVATLADTACGHAGLTLVAADQGLITVEYKINFVAPATGERLNARGEVVKPGRSLFICRSDVFAVQAGGERLCATALASWAGGPWRRGRWCPASPMSLHRAESRSAPHRPALPTAARRYPRPESTSDHINC